MKELYLGKQLLDNSVSIIPFEMGKPIKIKIYIVGHCDLASRYLLDTNLDDDVDFYDLGRALVK